MSVLNERWRLFRVLHTLCFVIHAVSFRGPAPLPRPRLRGLSPNLKQHQESSPLVSSLSRNILISEHVLTITGYENGGKLRLGP